MNAIDRPPFTKQFLLPREELFRFRLYVHACLYIVFLLDTLFQFFAVRGATPSRGTVRVSTPVRASEDPPTLRARAWGFLLPVREAARVKEAEYELLEIFSARCLLVRIEF